MAAGRSTGGFPKRPASPLHELRRMSLLSDPLTLAVLVVAVILLGMAKGGLAGA